MAQRDSIFLSFHNQSDNNLPVYPTVTFDTVASNLCPQNGSRAQISNGSHCGPMEEQLPRDMTFNDDGVVAVAAYTCLFLVAACGNLTVFITLFRNRRVKSRVNMFILHLSIADLIVTFIMLPLEISWHITVAWEAGDVACRVLMFFRAFGLYLSSFILVTISLDRYFAILHPLSLNDADKRGKIMLTLAWLFSLVASVPQSVIFHVEHHPKYSWYTQCVTFNFFPTPKHELAYNLFNIISLYGIPLLVITASYSLILCEISKKTRQSKEEAKALTAQTRTRLRRSSVGNIRRARSRTLKMTLVIVSVFVLCWTPYFVISAWYWFDKDTAKEIDPKIQKGLFIFAVSNSCMDPLVYGMFTINFKRELARCCCFKTAFVTKTTKGGGVHYRSSHQRLEMKPTSCGNYSKDSDMYSTCVEAPSVHAKHMIVDKSKSMSTPSLMTATPILYPSPRASSSDSRANRNNFMTLKIPLGNQDMDSKHSA